jgi:hypothetical protein
MGRIGPMRLTRIGRKLLGKGAAYSTNFGSSMNEKKYGSASLIRLVAASVIGTESRVGLRFRRPADR